jgi:hypothetical protein
VAETVNSHVITPAGVKCGGVADIGRLYSNTGSAGVKCGSSATVQFLCSLDTTGGVVCGGNTQQFYGVLGGGTADINSVWNSDILSGGVICGGTVITSMTMNEYGSGGAICGGRAYDRYTNEGFGGDSLRFYLTGAASLNGSQSDVAASLGGYHSSTEAERVSYRQLSAIKNLKILQASGSNGEGTAGTSTGGSAVASPFKASFSGPNGGTGVPVRIETFYNEYLEDSEDPNKWIRVQRTGDMSGIGTQEFDPQINNVFGMSNSENTESTSGGNRYRAVMIRNESINGATGVTLWLDTLATQAETVTGLPSSGAGIITAEENAFCDWQQKGWCRTGSGEVVYYDSRTDHSLNVPSFGRHLLGSSAVAGSPGETLDCVPPVRIGTEWAIPRTTGLMSTIVDETTAPISIGWSTAITQPTGLSIGTILPYEQLGLWIHREIPAGVSATPFQRIRIKCQFTVDGTTYTETLEGVFRIAVDALDRYELFVGMDEDPDTSGTPTQISAVLPFATTSVFPAGHTYHFVTVKRNRFDMSSESNVSYLRIDGSGNESELPPSAPDVVSWAPLNDGSFMLMATYEYESDSEAQRADQFAVWITTDGSDPDVSNAPTLITPEEEQTIGYVAIQYVTSTYSIPTTAKILVRSYRSADGDMSTNTDVHEATSGTTILTNQKLRGFWRQIAEQYA